MNVFFPIFKKYFFNLILERGREGKREGEKRPPVVACQAPPTGHLAHNLGMCPDWESNQQPFALQAGVPSTEPHQAGLFPHFLLVLSVVILFHLS